jgi:Arc/MetJ-type ribon-helix-helix transcriptional regulator
MKPISVPISDPELREFVDGLVASGVYPSAGQYVQSLIEEDRKRRARAKLEKLLLEGLEGEPIEVTPEFWEKMRKEFDERQARRNGK